MVKFRTLARAAFARAAQITLPINPADAAARIVARAAGAVPFTFYPAWSEYVGLVAARHGFEFDNVNVAAARLMNGFSLPRTVRLLESMAALPASALVRIAMAENPNAVAGEYGIAEICAHDAGREYQRAARALLALCEDDLVSALTSFHGAVPRAPKLIAIAHRTACAAGSVLGGAGDALPTCEALDSVMTRVIGYEGRWRHDTNAASTAAIMTALSEYSDNASTVWQTAYNAEVNSADTILRNIARLDA